MGLKDKNLISLKEIDGPAAPHDAFLKREVDLRKEALAYVDDVAKLAEYVGGEAESLGLRENWAIRKDVFPGVEIHFVYNRADDEFPASLRILYSGQRIRSISGEDLVELSIACLNQMLRYVKETVAEPPEICSKV
jgi:hypothetical protein